MRSTRLPVWLYVRATPVDSGGGAECCSSPMSIAVVTARGADPGAPSRSSLQPRAGAWPWSAADRAARDTIRLAGPDAPFRAVRVRRDVPENVDAMPRRTRPVEHVDVLINAAGIASRSAASASCRSATGTRCWRQPPRRVLLRARSCPACARAGPTIVTSVDVGRIARDPPDRRKSLRNSRWPGSRGRSAPRARARRARLLCFRATSTRR